MFRRLFENSPSRYLVLDEMDFQVVAVSEAYLAATMTRRDEILGRSLFDVFPDDPEDPDADGVRNLRASLGRVKSERRADVMAVQRYPIRRPHAEGGQFEERWWSVINTPIFSEQDELIYIIHRAEDVTPFVRRIDEEEKEQTDRITLESHVQLMQTEILLRAQDLQRANEQLRESKRHAELLRRVCWNVPSGMLWRAGMLWRPLSRARTVNAAAPANSKR